MRTPCEEDARGGGGQYLGISTSVDCIVEAGMRRSSYSPAAVALVTVTLIRTVTRDCRFMCNE